MSYYQIKFTGGTRYELVCYTTKAEAISVAKSVGLGYTIRSFKGKQVTA